MQYVIIGLGNPGSEYEKTRHNSGRIILEHFRCSYDFPEWKLDTTSHSFVSKGTLGKGKKSHTVTLIMPETFMNTSGSAVKLFVTNAKTAEGMMVIYDDLDLPFGTGKISFNKSSGGHKGLESIIRAVKTQAFSRMRIGIAPTTARGTIKKPVGESAINRFILGLFKPEELLALKKFSKKTNEALELFVTENREIAMNGFN